MKTLLCAALVCLAGSLGHAAPAAAETQSDWYETRCNESGCYVYACSHAYGCRPLFPVYTKER